MYENVIAIPYRNREAHLAYFMRHTAPLIKAHLPGTRIVVVEQAPGKLFNRGAVLNVAFKEFENKTKYFFTNDVDLNPTRKCIEEHYTKNVDIGTILGIYTSVCNTLGGIIKMRSQDIQKINGFPNNIWGWGTEDKALQNRAEHFGVKKEANMLSNREYPDYILKFNDVNDRNKFNESSNNLAHYVIWPKLDSATRLRLILSSGLNNIKYKVLERKNLSDITELIKVKI